MKKVRNLPTLLSVAGTDYVDEKHNYVLQPSHYADLPLFFFFFFFKIFATLKHDLVAVVVSLFYVVLHQDNTKRDDCPDF